MIQLTTQQHEELLKYKAEREALLAKINTPELHDFARGVVLEAVHQREKWGTEHDAGKTPQDWRNLLAYLSQKVIDALDRGDTDKAVHHTITTAAACANWHAAISGASTVMRPGFADTDKKLPNPFNDALAEVANG